MSKIILVTGGAGFAGSHFIRYLLTHYLDYKVINFDKLTYAGNLNNLTSINQNPHYFFTRGDIADYAVIKEVFEQFSPNIVVHFAAETQVARSYTDPCKCTKTNVLGTQYLLSCAAETQVERFIQISTDQVYGPMDTGAAKEDSILRPSNPNATTKAAADLLVQNAWHSFQVPTMIVRSCNLYGPAQFPEKLIPRSIVHVLRDLPLIQIGSGKEERDWLYIQDFCHALDVVMHKGTTGNIYHTAGGTPLTSMEVIHRILTLIQKPDYAIKQISSSFPSEHRYALSPGKLQEELGWKPSHSFDEGLVQTMQWYLHHTDWMEEVLDGEYRHYYRDLYEHDK